jgi:serine/threonine-protein kinase
MKTGGEQVERDAPVKRGDVVAGKYRVDDVIGVGGMGLVVAGTHIDLQQRVAVKFILPQFVTQDGLVERFLREARAVAKLKSEHVTRVLDVGMLESGAPFMVMEYLEGCDLGQLLSKHGRLPIETAADYIVQACEAVAEAHAQGIVHRDIKPQNLFLTQHLGGGSLVKVLDFGVSKTASAGASLTQSMTVIGSPLYMSPEQMRSSRDVDRRSDIWALGVVFFELLTGRLPFDGDSIPALCLKVVSDTAPSLATLRPDVSPELAAIVARCLEKDRERRFGDAAELAAALSRFVTPASHASIERARMVMSGFGRTGASRVTLPEALPPVSTSTDRPVAGPVPEEKAGTSRTAMLALLAGALVVSATIFGGGLALVEQGRTPLVATSAPLPAISIVAPPTAPTAEPPAPSASAPIAPPIAPAPSTNAAPARAIAPLKPAKPKLDDDSDIPALR